MLRDRRVADPGLLTVQHVAVTVASCGRAHGHRGRRGGGRLPSARGRRDRRHRHGGRRDRERAPAHDVEDGAGGGVGQLLDEFDGVGQPPCGHAFAQGFQQVIVADARALAQLDAARRLCRSSPTPTSWPCPPSAIGCC